MTKEPFYIYHENDLPEPINGVIYIPYNTVIFNGISAGKNIFDRGRDHLYTLKHGHHCAMKALPRSIKEINNR